MLDPKQITDDLRGAFRGALAFDALTRGLYATDASPFHVAPLAVAVPEDADDVAALVRYCAEHNIPVVPRGGGTGVAGESLGPAVVVDLSVKFKRIGAVTGDRVTAEPGVTCDALNTELARHGRRFAPDPASAATCTVGGMVATNASGGNAFRHGYTRDHVAGLSVVLDDGSPAVLGDDPKANASERLDQIRTATAELLAANRAAIEQHRPRTKFNRCGYVLHDVLTPAGPDLVKLLVGSEGTLAVTTAATLRTVPLPGGTCVALVGFPTLDAAVRAGTDLRHFEPVACDLLDRRLLSVTRRGGPDGFGPVPPAVGAALVVTFEADTEREAGERAWGAVETLRHRHLLRVLAEPTCDPAGVARIRDFRGTAVSGLYGLAGGARPLAFVEDVAVPVESLPAYLAGVQDALKRHELTASFLIHALTGQVHTRPLVDLNDPADRAKLWPAAEDIHSLALSLGGTVSTQHGTGLARTPWVERQYGPVYAVFREVKRVFDPKNVLNPGKIVGPDPSREAWPLRLGMGNGKSEIGKNGIAGGEALGSAPTPNSQSPIPLLVWKDSSPAHEVAKCSGCGDCRTANPAKRMCPVFRATGDEAASPRAKPNLLRVLADPGAAAPEEVRAVAALCVNCKMCRDECDARVNVPKLMIETKAALHAEHGLGWNEWAQARMEGLSVLGSNFAPVVNTLLGRLGARWVLEKLLGVSRHRRLPAFTLRNFFRRARGAGLSKKRGTGPRPEFRNGRVAYFVDVYAAYTDPAIAEATVAVLHHNGVEVYVPPRQVGCGMGALAVGDLETAREHAVRNVRALADLVREGYRVVCSEPTAALMLSQDYPDLLDDADTAAVAAATVELTAYLAELHAAGRLRTDFRPLDLTLGHHVPCHVKALRGTPAGPGLLSLIPGLRVRTIDVGCSGMAGQWGLMAANREASLAAGAPVFAELNRPGLIFGSTECSSCRIQLQDGTGKRTLHPVEYLALAYGLMPEIEARLRRPLTELVTE
ncbi:FAD-linked oxidase C-terminal domain-containing protein [Gemmata sp.]|uniref:FAD-linked oxidase C-terminal domain-containing protein n=1 Tax=Gemmata sp. TaxID=1914242 RepID=UPI003F6F3C69